MPKENNKLSPKQKLFVDKYVAYGFNGHKAAVDAGYSEKTADVQASKMLRIPKIKKYLAKRIKYVITNTDELSIQLIEKLKTIAFSNIKDIAFWNDGCVDFYDSDKLDDSETFAISEISGKTYYDAEGTPVNSNVKVKMVDKLKAIDMLARFVELYEVNKDEDEEKDNLTESEKLSKQERTEKLLDIQKRLKDLKK